MKFKRCPVCHSHIELLSLVEDEAGRELLALVATLDDTFSPSALSYLSLFKPAKSDLNNARALKLLKQLLALSPDLVLLARACEITTATMREKRSLGQIKPLKDHNYLKKVLESQHHEVTSSIATSNVNRRTNGKSLLDNPTANLLELEQRLQAKL